MQKSYNLKRTLRLDVMSSKGFGQIANLFKRICPLILNVGEMYGVSSGVLNILRMFMWIVIQLSRFI